MEIAGIKYVEARPIKNWRQFESKACTGCALHQKLSECGIAIDGAAKSAFGGHCEDRDVIYKRVPNAKLRRAS